MATDWREAMSDLPMTSVTEHWPVLRGLSGYHGPWQESLRAVAPAPRSLPERTGLEALALDDPNDDRPVGHCEVCKKPYRMNSSWQRCCGQSCAATLRNQKLKDRKAEQLAAGAALNVALDEDAPRLCIICQRPMVKDPKTGYRPNKTQLACSRDCGTELRAQRQRAAEEERYQRACAIQDGATK